MGSVFETGPYRWPDEAGPWRVVLYWTVLAERLECVGMQVLPLTYPEAPPGAPPPFTTTVYRSIPVGRLVEEHRLEAMRAAQHAWERWAEEAQSPGQARIRARRTRRLRDASEQTPERQRRGGRPALYPPEHYEQVARVYEEAWRQGSTRPTKAVIAWAHEQGHRVSPSAVAKWVARARRMGLLGPTGRGRAGGVAPAEEREEER